ncbi:unnamed protein product [Porites evermanni]|uniref:Uncharacterized protein n=1 Tax=Porites evermanni TaxID=104178 RepID=A0ABN8LVM7_9CNID|nr:unnamed protein product [Porites evermanni]
MAQRELELSLERRRQELEQLRKQREDDLAIISAQEQAEKAELENKILGQVLIERQENRDPHAVSEFESKGVYSSPYIEDEPGMSMEYVSQESKPVVYPESFLSYDIETAISYENTPLSTTSKSLPLKNLQFHTANSNVPNLGTSQEPIAKGSETDVLPSSTTVNLPDQSLLHPGKKCSFQATLAMMNSLQMVM